MTTPSVLTSEQRAFVVAARTAILGTRAPNGRPRMVPVCFVLDGDLLVTPLDEKPKSVDDPHDLARVRDVSAERRVLLLIHRWDEDWSRLGWVRLRGDARVVEPGDPAHAAAIVPLRAKYPQYEAQAIDRRPMLAVAIDGVSAWGSLEP
jgi:PPOX class probable F420-dependent enzyme